MKKQSPANLSGAVAGTPHADNEPAVERDSQAVSYKSCKHNDRRRRVERTLAQEQKLEIA